MKLSQLPVACTGTLVPARHATHTPWYKVLPGLQAVHIRSVVAVGALVSCSHGLHVFSGKHLRSDDAVGARNW